MAVIDPYKASKTPSVQKVNGSVPAPTPATSPAAVQSVSKAPGIPKPPAQQQTFSTPQYADWLTKQNETFANLEKLVNTPFNYNPETDPAYQAQRQLAQQGAQQASNRTLESMNERGIMGSSLTANQLGQIQQQAEQQAAAYIPIYREQAYSQYQNQLANAANLLSQARALRGDQFGEGVTEAQLTGNYMSPEARTLLNNLLDLKTQTEANWSTMNAEQRAAARAQGDQMRAQLQGMGVDSSLFGANVAANAARGNLGQAGLRTLAGQELDFGRQVDQRNFDRGVLESDRNFDRSILESDRNFNFQKAQTEWENMFKQEQFNEQKAARLWEQSFQEKSFQQSVKDAAAARGLQWANLNQRQKEFIADQAFREKQFQLEQARFDAQQSAPQNYDYRTDPNFADDIAFINADPQNAVAEVRSNAQALIQQYGYNGYVELLRAAEAATPKEDNRFPGITFPQ